MILRNSTKVLCFIIVAGVLLSTVVVIFVALPSQGGKKDMDAHIVLEQQEWIRGASECNMQNDPLIQIVKYDRSTWIFRQNMCVHYEAPFMYLFVGKNQALLIDTGATADETMMPLYEIVSGILSSATEENRNQIPLIVAHSHSHADHYEGDGQFKGKSNVSVVGLELDEVKTFFNLNQWPNGESTVDLGERIITVFPIPGHQVASLAFHDSSSKLLITGDTFYPGRLYIFDWIAFKQSISKLYDFARQHEISYIVGTHIEMSKVAGIDYPVGSTYHPDEQKLPLTIDELGLLNDSLQKTSDTTPERIVFDKFIAVPR